MGIYGEIFSVHVYRPAHVCRECAGPSEHPTLTFCRPEREKDGQKTCTHPVQKKDHSQLLPPPDPLLPDPRVHGLPDRLRSADETNRKGSRCEMDTTKNSACSEIGRHLRDRTPTGGNTPTELFKDQPHLWCDPYKKSPPRPPGGGRLKINIAGTCQIYRTRLFPKFPPRPINGGGS